MISYHDIMADYKEPLLQGETRLVTLPIPMERILIWEAYKRMFSAIWPSEHFKFSKDLNDWRQKLNDAMRFVIIRVLTFFAASDSLVNANLLENFIGEVKWLEVIYVYNTQVTVENVHSETYANAIMTFEPDEERRQMIRDAVNDDPSISAKAAFAKKWTNSDAPFALRLVAFAIFEGVFFSGSFCVLYWLKDMGLMHELCASNEAIAKDEGEHVKFACLLFREYIVNRPDVMTIEQLFREAVKIEKDFVRDSIKVPMIGMNADKMCQYIEFVADGLLMDLGYRSIWKSSNPFRFMDKINADAIDNFFDKPATTYSGADVGSAVVENPYASDDDMF